MSRIDLANNTGCDIRVFEAQIISAVCNGDGIPEELADLFALEITTNGDGTPRGILTLATGATHDH